MSITNKIECFVGFYNNSTYYIERMKNFVNLAKPFVGEYNDNHEVDYDKGTI